MSDFVLSLSCSQCGAGDMFICVSEAKVADLAAKLSWDVAADSEVESELLLRLVELGTFGEPLCRDCAAEAGLL